jgi:hypothetical protein
MSEFVHQMLVHGMAAAKSGQPQDKEEARRYLEWVLSRDDADVEMKAAASLWLSQVEDDPKKKRDYLEYVLGADPANALARRSLALLDGHLKAEDVIDPNQPIAPVTPNVSPSPKSVRRYACSKCGGRMAYDAAKRSLTCESCGNHLFEYQALQQGALISEQDFTATLPTAKAYRWELPAERVLKCEACGAMFVLPPLQISGVCFFCGSNHVIIATTGELIQPEAVLPFQFNANAAVKFIRRWIDQQRFRPDDLDERAAIAKPRGVYLPCWTFDLGGTMNWHALIGGISHQGDLVVWTSRNEIYPVYHDDLLVPATHSVSPDLLNDILEFDTKALVPYSTDLLADYAAEIYQIPLSEASLVARRRALKIGQDQVQQSILAGKTYKDFFMSTGGLVIESYKLVLLPIWIAAYRYKKEKFAVAVNGQSGVVSGKVPRSGLQKALAGFFGEN